jgi:hypothetical protein
VQNDDTKDQTTIGRRLYLITGVMCLGTNIKIMPGLLMAASEDEARGAHMKWMKEQHPEMAVQLVAVTSVFDSLIREAMESLQNGE